MTSPVTEDTVRALRLRTVIDELWPEADRDVALARVLIRTAPDRAEAVPRDAPVVAHHVSTELAPEHRRSRWPRGVGVAAAVVVLLVGVGAALLELRQSNTDRSAPLSPTRTVSTSTSTTGSSDPLGASIKIPFDHIGSYHYTSAPFTLAHPPNSVGIASKILGGSATLTQSPRVGMTDGPRPGQYVIVADFAVGRYDQGAYLEIQPPQLQGTAGLAPCEASTTTVEAGRTTAAGGHSAVELLFTNTAFVACTLTGYPTVTAHVGTQTVAVAQTPIGYMTPGSEDPTRAVTIQPSSSATAVIEWNNVIASPSQTCAADTFTDTVDVTPPVSGGRASTLPVHLPTCQGSEPQVHPIGPS